MPQFMPGQILIAFQEGVSKKAQKKFLKENKFQVIREFARIKIWLVAVPIGQEQVICTRLKELHSNLVLIAKPNYKI